MRQGIIARLQAHVDVVSPGGVLRLYGSSSCHLNAKGADLDLTLLLAGGPPSHEHQKAVVQQLGLVLGSRGQWREVEAITASRVPIVTLVDVASGLHVDISVGNTLARLKTLLLHSYASIDPRARALIFLVKRWAHMRRLNEPKERTPNSYTWAQLALFYLQQCEPPLLPCLHLLSGGAWSDAWRTERLAELLLLLEPPPPASAQAELAEEMRRDREAVREAAARAHRGAAGVGLGQLLVGFFGFWLEYCDGLRKTSVVSVRHGRLLSLRETPFAPDAEHERPILGVADPVEPSHNLGRVLTGRTLGTVRSELQRALDHLAAGQPLGGMLAPHSAG